MKNGSGWRVLYSLNHRNLNDDLFQLRWKIKSQSILTSPTPSISSHINIICDFIPYFDFSSYIVQTNFMPS